MTFLLLLLEKLIPSFEPPVATTSIRKILVIDLNFLGDMVMASPVYRALKEHISGAQIEVLGLNVAAPALMANPFIDRLHLINRAGVFTLLQTAQTLRGKEFDLVLQLNTSLKTNVLMWMIGKRLRLGYNFAHRGCFNNVRIPLATRTTRVGNRIDECVALLEKAFGWSVVDRSTIFSVPAAAEEGMRRVLSGEGINRDSLLIGMHTNCRQGHKQRRWSSEKFVEMANRLIEGYNATILLTGGSEDRGYTEAIARAIDAPAQVRNFAGKLSLLEFAALLRRLTVFVTINTGPMHIAIALRTPTVAILGGTPPSVVFPANDPRYHCIADPALDQWNPAELYPSYSPLIQTIEVNQVVERVEFLLSSMKARAAEVGPS